MILATIGLTLLLSQLHIPAEGAPQQAPAQDPNRLRVLVGKSLIVNSPQPLSRVSLTDPAIATALVTSERQVLIHGLKPGSVTLLLWDTEGRTQSFNLSVEIDIPGLRELMERILPEEKIELRQSGASLVLSGEVTTDSAIETAGALAQTQSPAVVNLLVRPEKNDVVLLQVRFAEVNRSALQELGLNIFSTGGANTFGSVTTQQFSQILGNVGAVPGGVDRGTDPETPSLVGGGIGRTLQSSPGVFGLTDLLNIFVFRPDLNLGITLRALQQRNLLQILAEPNVMALNGREASFLAGGEFPFPVVQGGTTGVNAVTIEFKEFGVRLKFTPELMPDDKIRLKIAPEVSALDFTNALVLSGFTIPALSTRRAETEVELMDGQSFAIAGLIDDRMVEIASKIPILGDIPVLGKIFRSRSVDRSNSELLVMVTPRLVKPLDPDQVPTGPEFPGKFLDKDKFDQKGKKPSSGGAGL